MIKRIEAITIPFTTGFVFSVEITTIEKIVMSAKAIASLWELNKGICARDINKTTNNKVMGIGTTHVLGVDLLTYKVRSSKPSAEATCSSNKNLSWIGACGASEKRSRPMITETIFEVDKSVNFCFFIRC
jgi:hypothetical protein